MMTAILILMFFASSAVAEEQVRNRNRVQEQSSYKSATQGQTKDQQQAGKKEQNRTRNQAREKNSTSASGK